MSYKKEISNIIKQTEIMSKYLGLLQSTIENITSHLHSLEEEIEYEKEDCRSPEKFLSSKEAAEFLGIKPQLLAMWRYKENPPIPFIKMGGLIRYKLTDVERFSTSGNKK